MKGIKAKDLEVGKIYTCLLSERKGVCVMQGKEKEIKLSLEDGIYLYDTPFDGQYEPIEEEEFKVGSRVKVISNISAHDFETGAVVTIRGIDDDIMFCMDDDGITWHLQVSDLQLVED